MKVSQETAREFLREIPITVHLVDGGAIGHVGVKYGWCGEADKKYGRKTVLMLLDLFETDEQYQKLIDEMFISEQLCE